MFCLVILLDTLLKSNTYKRFSKENLIKFQEISTTKSKCMTYLYNNNKLRKIIKIQYEKDAMTQKIRLIKNQLQLWNKKYIRTEDVDNLRNTAIFNLKDDEDEFQKTFSEHESLLQRNNSLKKIEETKKSIGSGASQKFSADNKSIAVSNITGLTDINKAFIKDNDYLKLEDEDLLNELKKKHLNWITRTLNWMKRYYSNQLLLVSSSSRIEAIEKQLNSGRHRVNTTLENKLLMQHYISNYESKEKINRLNKLMPLRYNLQNHDYSDAKKQRLNRFQFSTIIGIIASNTSILCYLFMLI